MIDLNKKDEQPSRGVRVLLKLESICGWLNEHKWAQSFLLAIISAIVLFISVKAMLIIAGIITLTFIIRLILAITEVD